MANRQVPQCPFHFGTPLHSIRGISRGGREITGVTANHVEQCGRELLYNPTASYRDFERVKYVVDTFRVRLEQIKRNIMISIRSSVGRQGINYVTGLIQSMEDNDDNLPDYEIMAAAQAKLDELTPYSDLDLGGYISESDL